ncbi:MAG TPA: bile acid:sodium symporter family protein [Magnetospirillum sp.]|jgi:sodium/bile acid cotransporter 7|nr:bile acid:sodium symporter family protein [Magnetospirillum sp.]
MRWLARIRPDNFTLGLLGMVALASVLPAHGTFAAGFATATKGAIALLFFLYGARLSTKTVLDGLTHWRLHLAVSASTWVLFPLLGLAVVALPDAVLPHDLAIGILFLSCLPSTVQSSIAFTSIAGGNVSAAICSASTSNLMGVVLTPLLVGLLMGAQSGGVSLDSIQTIALQILAPFVVGHSLRPLIGAWAGRNKKALGFVDRGSILMVVYGAFSEAVSHGLWSQLSVPALVAMVVVEGVFLALVLWATGWGSRRLGFSRPDQIAIVFCGSKKSLATGAPMASVLFPAATAGMVVLPLMLFHQIQLMVCAVLARKWAEKAA